MVLIGFEPTSVWLLALVVCSVRLIQLDYHTSSVKYEIRAQLKLVGRVAAIILCSSQKKTTTTD